VVEPGDSPGWVAELDVRVGGSYRFLLRDRALHDIRGVYTEVEKTGSSYSPGTSRCAARAASTVTVLLSPAGDGTELEFTLDPVFDPRAAGGWQASFNRLESFLSTL